MNVVDMCTCVFFVVTKSRCHSQFAPIYCGIWNMYTSLCGIKLSAVIALYIDYRSVCIGKILMFSCLFMDLKIFTLTKPCANIYLVMSQ